MLHDRIQYTSYHSNSNSNNGGYVISVTYAGRSARKYGFEWNELLIFCFILCNRHSVCGVYSVDIVIFIWSFSLCASTKMTHNWMLLWLFAEKRTLHTITSQRGSSLQHANWSDVWKTEATLEPRKWIEWMARSGIQREIHRKIEIFWAHVESTVFYLWINMQPICASCKCVLLTRQQFSNKHTYV